MKVCFIASLMMHLCAMAVLKFFVREDRSMPVKEKPGIYVTLVEPPGSAAAPRAEWRPGKAEGKQSRSRKPGNSLPHPARKKPPRAKTVTPPGTPAGVVEPQILRSSSNAGPTENTVKEAAGQSPSVSNYSGSGTGETQALTGTGTSGCGKGNAPAGGMTEDFTFGDGSGPSFLQKAPVIYPFIARRMGRQGTVLLRLTIDEKGKLLGVEVLKDPGCGFAESAIEAVKKSRFSPARRNGRPVPSRVTLPIRFVLEESE